MQWVLTFALVAVVLIGPFVQGWRVRRAWSKAAEQLGLEERGRSQMEGDYLGREVSIRRYRVATKMSDGSASSRWYTRARAPSALPLDLKVTSEKAFVGIRRMLGREGFEVGDRRFDSDLGLEGSEADLVARLDAPTRRSLEAAVDLGKLLITDDVVQITRRGAVTDARVLHELAAAVASLADRFEFPPSERAGRLLALVEQDPASGVRDHALRLLEEHHPGSPELLQATRAQARGEGALSLAQEAGGLSPVRQVGGLSAVSEPGAAEVDGVRAVADREGPGGDR